VALTQGDPAGVGPEIIVKLLESQPPNEEWRPLVFAEKVALESVPLAVSGSLSQRLVYLPSIPSRSEIEALPVETVAVVDPVAEDRSLDPGQSGPADAGGAMAALDAGIEAVSGGSADALITTPVSKASIAQHHRPDFRGHTEYLAEAAGLERYGRDYLMAFLTPDLQVALLTTHLPLRQALDEIREESLIEALLLLDRAAGGRMVVAGVNPHAGEGGLMGTEEMEIVQPAIERAKETGIDVSGPDSPDSLFARARQGEYDWVLSLYHDQGLIAVKTSAFGLSTNWTLGLPFLRTSVDHGTAFDIAGRGDADPSSLIQVVQTTLDLISGDLPRGTQTWPHKKG
jgi:4-hydroxythreonine-4-phosphate dehydrogenase